MPRLEAGFKVGPYVALSPLGEGGMGEVWRARDDRLGRDVALKHVSGELTRDQRERLWREARAAATLSHPNVCQIFDVLEERGELFLALELLQGEPLDARLLRGPYLPGEAVVEILGVLAALEALHGRGFIHRDLKPSNIFCTPHGPKLLDFGLVLPVDSPEPNELRLTRTGVAVGTPRYMSPEQWSGARVSPATDLFACGAILYEMLSGSPAFPGDDPVAVFEAIARGKPPRALAGSPVAVALDRVVARALALRPEDRFDSAAAMASALRAIAAPRAQTTVLEVEIRAVTRLVVAPFRLLRPDPEIGFLGEALADAVSASLRGVGNLVVRSSRVVVESGGDPRTIATAAGADAVLIGTLLRAGERVRLTTELIEAASGTVLSTARAEARLDDLFELQDELARQVVETLRVPLDAEDRGQLAREAPTSPAAYEWYLRGSNRAVSTASATSLLEARSLLERCLEVDPNFAPAWARLGRIQRLLAKYGHADVEAGRLAARRAFETALALAPDHPLVHNLYTNFEIEDLKSPLPAMLRLLGRIESHGSDPDLFVGLIAACRYAGLLDASLAAFERAQRLDPQVFTSVHFTYLMMGEWQQAVDHDVETIGFMRLYALPMLGRAEEAIEGFRAWSREAKAGVEVWIGDSTQAAAQDDRERAVASAEHVLAKGFDDAEGIYLLARNVSKAGAVDFAFTLLQRVVDGHFTVPRILEVDPWLEPMRSDPRFAGVYAAAVAGERHARELFVRAGGPRLLGL